MYVFFSENVCGKGVPVAKISVGTAFPVVPTGRDHCMGIWYQQFAANDCNFTNYLYKNLKTLKTLLQNEYLVNNVPDHHFCHVRIADLPRSQHPNQFSQFYHQAAFHWCTSLHFRRPRAYSIFMHLLKIQRYMFSIQTHFMSRRTPDVINSHAIPTTFESIRLPYYEPKCVHADALILARWVTTRQ